MAAEGSPAGWVQVVGYRHEVMHTGVLAALLNCSQAPGVAGRLINRGAGSVREVGKVKSEAKLPGAGGKADLTAPLVLADGTDRWLAVETKVHSDGSRDQLRGITGGSQDAEGVFLATGLTSYKLTALDTKRVSCEGKAPWHWVGSGEWLSVLDEADAGGMPWLPEYRMAVERWEDELDDVRRRGELEHLQWMCRLRSLLPEPESWREVRTLQSGPLLSRFDWSNELGGDIYLEFMGLHDGRRVLRVKVGGNADLDPLEDCVRPYLDELQKFEPGGRRGRKSRTVAETKDLGDDMDDAVHAALEAVEVLDEMIDRSGR